MRQAEGRFHYICNRVGLHRIANTEAGYCRKDGEQHAHPGPFFAKAVANVIHGPANMGATLIHLSETHGKNGFRVLCGHAHEGGKPHPEQGAWPPEENSGRNACNIACSDGCRQGGHERLEWWDFTVCLRASGAAATPQ